MFDINCCYKISVTTPLSSIIQCILFEHLHALIFMDITNFISGNICHSLSIDIWYICKGIRCHKKTIVKMHVTLCIKYISILKYISYSIQQLVIIIGHYWYFHSLLVLENTLYWYAVQLKWQLYCIIEVSFSWSRKIIYHKMIIQIQ